MSGKCSLVFRASLVSHRRLGTWRQTAFFELRLEKGINCNSCSLRLCLVGENKKVTEIFWGSGQAS